MEELNRVRDCLSGRCSADEQTLFAIESLSERLERLKLQNPLFSGVVFSDDLQQIYSRAVYSAAS